MTIDTVAVLQSLVNGILLGGLYACFGVGFALVWGVMNLMNLAHGMFIILGAYITFALFQVGVDPFLSLPVSMGSMFVLAYFVQRFVINLVVKAQVFMTLILTFGLEMVIINVLLFFVQADFRSVSPWYAGLAIPVGPVVIPIIRFAVFVSAVLITSLLYLFITKTKLGIAILATGQDREAAELSGASIGRVYSLSFGIGGALAGAAGTFVAMLYSFSPIMGGPYTLKAFVITILGGLGSMAGPIVGGVILGLTETGGAMILSEGYKDILGYGLLLLILIIRPEGMIGKKFFADIK